MEVVQLTKKYLVIILSVFFTIMISCNDGVETGGQSKTGQNQNKIFETFAKNLEKSILEGNYSFLNTSWDIELFKQKIKANGKVKASVLEGGEKYYRKVIFKSNNDMVDEVKRYNKFVLSRFYFDGKTPKAIYTFKSDLGINFIEFVLRKKGEEIKIVDFYNFQMGEYYSLSVYKMIKNLEKYGSNEGAYSDALYLSNLSIKLINDEQYQKAWETVNKIADKMIVENYFQVKRITVARTNPTKTYIQAMQDFIDLNPENERLKLYYQSLIYQKQGKRRKLKQSNKQMKEIVGESELFGK